MLLLFLMFSSNVCDSDVVGEPIELFDKVDSLLFEGSSAEDHESAHKLLMENEHEVSIS